MLPPTPSRLCLCERPLPAAVWSAFALPPQRAHRFAPTVLPLAQSVPARPSAPLDNRKIAFGCVRLAPPPLCAKAARLSGAMRRAVGTGALAALGRLATPPPRIPLSPWMRNPSANAPCMAWSGYLPAPCNAASRRLAHPGAESALAPWSAPPHPARAIRKVSAQALPLAPLDLRHASASLHLGARALALREARRGGGDTRRSKRRRRDAQDAAHALARRDGRYSDQAPRCAGAVGLRALRRMRAR